MFFWINSLVSKISECNEEFFFEEEISAENATESDVSDTEEINLDENYFIPPFSLQNALPSRLPKMFRGVKNHFFFIFRDRTVFLKLSHLIEVKVISYEIVSMVFSLRNAFKLQTNIILVPDNYHFKLTKLTYFKQNAA